MPLILETLKDKFNIIERKTSILKPPKNIPSVNHALSYIIGYIDGDGCISKSKTNQMITIVGTYDILNFIKKVFSCYCDMVAPIRSIKNTNKVFVLSFAGNLREGKYTFLTKKLLSLDVPRMKRKWKLLTTEQSVLR